MTEAEELRREHQRAERARRALPGPCILCGKHQDVLYPGRDAGFHVYCAVCAIGTRTPASLESSR
jgi:hypothetical protein